MRTGINVEKENDPGMSILILAILKNKFFVALCDFVGDKNQ
jgi:hypothetical protein